MRGYLVILICFLLNLAAASATATDVFLGTVKSVEPETGEVVLELEDLLDEATGNPKEITIQIPPERMPEYVSAGRTVRVWGEYIGGTANAFKVLHIRGGSPRGGMADPTGVRSRLWKGMGKGGTRGRMRGKGGGGNH
jgi:hypothetical protein